MLSYCGAPLSQLLIEGYPLAQLFHECCEFTVIEHSAAVFEHLAQPGAFVGFLVRIKPQVTNSA